MVTERHKSPDLPRIELGHKTRNRSQSVSTALDILIGVADKHKNNSDTILTEKDYQLLVPRLGDLADVVRDDENHLFAPLLEFVVVLIENYEKFHVLE